MKPVHSHGDTPSPRNENYFFFLSSPSHFLSPFAAPCFPFSYIPPTPTDLSPSFFLALCSVDPRRDAWTRIIRGLFHRGSRKLLLFWLKALKVKTRRFRGVVPDEIRASDAWPSSRGGAFDELWVSDDNTTEGCFLNLFFHGICFSWLCLLFIMALLYYVHDIFVAKWARIGRSC